MKKIATKLNSSLLCIALFFLSFLFTLPASAQWEQTAGPEGITINVFYNYGNYVFSGSDAKGVFRSDDHGLNWIPANAGLENSAIFSFTITLDGRNFSPGIYIAQLKVDDTLKLIRMVVER
ncbi:MAG: hypothetical protein IPO83_05905 [Chitinophagaceae bacterium]|nr:hypothetical protein [Chitinophagaceae bacterium]